MNKSILKRSREKHAEHVDKNMGKVLSNLSEYNNGLSIVDIFAILSDYLSNNLLNNSNNKLAYEISKEIRTNEKLTKLFKEVGSAHLNGVILTRIGLSMMNLDRFADTIINESIDKGEFLSSDLDILKSFNVNNVKKTTLDRVNHYLVTGEKNLPLKKKEIKTDKCSCEKCTCGLNIKENKYDREEAIKMLAERMAAINYSKEKLNKNVIEISDDELFLLILQSLIR